MEFKDVQKFRVKAFNQVDSMVVKDFISTKEVDLKNVVNSGPRGISPIIEVKKDTAQEYILSITDADGVTSTPNLKGKDGAYDTNSLAPSSPDEESFSGTADSQSTINKEFKYAINTAGNLYSDGAIAMDENYSPMQPKSIATKEYVDGYLLRKEVYTNPVLSTDAEGTCKWVINHGLGTFEINAKLYRAADNILLWGEPIEVTEDFIKYVFKSDIAEGQVKAVLIG